MAVAAVAALAINALLLLGLAKLNRPAPVEAMSTPAMQVRLVQLPDVVLPPPEEQTIDPPAEEDWQEDLPPVEVPEVSPPLVPLDLPAFDPSPRITVHVPRPQPVRALPPLPPRDTTPREQTAQPPARGGGAMGADDVDHPPRILERIPPTYPRLALRRGEQGQVTVRVLVDAKGDVESFEIVGVSGSRAFEHAVASVLPRWRFVPAQYAGRAVRCWIVETIDFQLAPR